MAEATVVYKASPGARLSHRDAQVVGQRLTELQQRDGGLEVRAVLADARDEASPLHQYFTWDDGKAALEWRLNEARRLIRSVRVIIQRSPEQRPLEIHAFMRVTSEAKGRYLPVTQVMGDDDMRKQVLSKALLELQAWRTRYATLSELATIFDAMESVQLAKAG